MEILHSLQGECIDAVCYRFYGHSDFLEAVIQANPKLVELGPVLPIGTPVVMPQAGQAPAKTIINLWD